MMMSVADADVTMCVYADPLLIPSTTHTLDIIVKRVLSCKVSRSKEDELRWQSILAVYVGPHPSIRFACRSD
jgi:hypothetical protein